MTSIRTALVRASALLLAPCVAAAQGPKSTGLAAIGSVDPNWVVAYGPTGGALGPFASAFVLSRSPSVPGSYQWIAPDASGSVPGGAADSFLTRFTYAFRTTFVGGSVTSFSFTCAVDDTFLSVVLNGVTTGATCNQYTLGATQTVTGVLAGSNTLQFNTTGNGITDGLVVQVTAVTTTATPEPVTIALVGAGLVGLGLVRRRRGGA